MEIITMVQLISSAAFDRESYGHNLLWNVYYGDPIYLDWKIMLPLKLFSIETIRIFHYFKIVACSRFYEIFEESTMYCRPRTYRHIPHFEELV